jgi:DNA-binding NarL/FixJ family response regulator
MGIIVDGSDMTNPNHEHLINLLLVNETRLMGNVIAAALEGEPDINVVACVTNIHDAMQIVREQEIDVALVSTRLPDQGALQLTSAITEFTPATKVLALGLTEEKQHVLRYVEAGATGYVLKDDSLDGLIETIRAAQAGKAIVSPKIAAAIMERLTALARLFSDVENSVGETSENLYLNLYPHPMTMHIEILVSECYAFLQRFGQQTNSESCLHKELS